MPGNRYDVGTASKRGGDGQTSDTETGWADDAVDGYGSEADRSPSPCDAPDLLGALIEDLIRAHRWAELDGDPQTVLLVEAALFHVGKRLMRSLSPTEARAISH